MGSLSILVVSIISLLCFHLSDSIDSIKSDNECGRHRKAWHLLSSEERNQFISGFHKLNDLGKIRVFSGVHYMYDNYRQAHSTSAFFAWHRYIIWELESQIRDLGDEYKCFALPYWDFSYELGRENEPFITNSGIGGDGIYGQDMCISGNKWTADEYPTYRDCDISHGESIPCCLKRDVLTDSDNLIPSYSTMIASILQYNYFGHYGNSSKATSGFKGLFQFGYHTNSHIFVGGGESKQKKVRNLQCFSWLIINF